MTYVYFILLFFVLSLVILNYNFDLNIEPDTINSICQDEKENRLEEKGKLSDKLQVKTYLKENFPEVKFSKVIYELDNPEDLRTLELPENFVMKSSSGARMFHIVTNGNYSVDDLIKKGKKFLNTNYTDRGYRKIPLLNLREPHYSYNSKKLLIEEYLEDIAEFRLMMVDGKIIYYEKTNPGEECEQFDKNTDKLDNFTNMNTVGNKLEKNITLEKIEEFCKNFYKKEKFKLTRMDFYIKKDMSDFYFGEITFTPENCRYKYGKKFNDYFKNL